MTEVEKRTLPVETCVARNRQGLNGKNRYSQVEGYMTVDYINDEPIAFSLCPSRKIPKGFDGFFECKKMSKKTFFKKLSEARAIDSDRIRSNWVEVL